jgi:hypothetical protein
MVDADGILLSKSADASDITYPVRVSLPNSSASILLDATAIFVFDNGLRIGAASCVIFVLIFF